ncbi:uncharacterized protein LOC129595520 [Paramacrobiotus metropolitanus]|uniref:uncharacterized protein LOC129595520 n=1 Tax=Paramacrobiotus metropolitanus TaxID=2943436 RepID=UPI00244572AA|nr:uncharacterized protein LOC129595520 [Paramacrobiotus metropolitanus]
MTELNIGRQECEGCQKHLATVKRLSEVTYQQAITIKDQQNTINQLIGQKGVGTAAVAESSPVVAKTSGGRRAPASNSNGSLGSRYKPAAHSPKPKSKRRAPLPVAAEEPKVARVAKTENNNDEEEDTVEVTRIWITGTPNPRTRCPLPECAHRDFSANDMYHFRRHFTQVHRLTHPNPEFILQCPVDNCIAEYENSLKDIKEHMRKEHPELFDNVQKNVKVSKSKSKSKKKKSRKASPARVSATSLPQNEEVEAEEDNTMEEPEDEQEAETEEMDEE